MSGNALIFVDNFYVYLIVFANIRENVHQVGSIILFK